MRSTLLLLRRVATSVRYLVGTAWFALWSRACYNTNTNNSLANATVPLTNYTIPGSGVLYVATTGNDTTGDGSLGNPYATIGKAHTVASAGNTIVVHAGEYPEQLTISKAVTIQAYPNEVVWVDGRDPVAPSGFTGPVSGRYTLTGIGGATAHTYKWLNGSDPAGDWISGAKVADGSGTYESFVDTTNAPRAAYPDLVTYNNTVLTWAANAAAVASGQMFIDYSTSTLTIGDDPGAGTVRFGRYQTILTVTAAATFNGIGFRAAATHRDTFGMVKINNNAAVFENCVGVYAQAGTAFFLGSSGAGAILRKVQAAYNGNAGIGGSTCDGATVIYSRVAYNNWRYYKNWEAAGMKIGGHTANMIVKYSIFELNRSKGCWADVGCYAWTIAGCISRYNANSVTDALDSQGFMYEISGFATIAGNLSYHNDGHGYYISDSNNNLLYLNVAHDNKNQEIAVFENAQGTTPNATDISRGVTMNATGNVIRGNVISRPASSYASASTALVRIRDTRGTSATDASAMVTDMDYNLYWRGASATNTKLISWRPAGASDTDYSTLAAFVAATGRDAHSSEADNNVSPHPYFADPTQDDFRIISSSAPTTLTSGILPALVTSALGLVAHAITDTGAYLYGRVPAALTTYARDLFNRPAATSSFGTADVGGAWTLFGTASNFSLTGWTGSISLPAASTGQTAYLGSVSQRDVTAQVLVWTDKLAVGGNLLGYLVLRRSAVANYEYRVRLRFDTSQVLRLSCQKLEGSSTEVQVGSESSSLGITHAVYTAYWLKAQQSGTTTVTTLIKCWPEGTAEPAAWTVTATDSTPHANLQVAGFPGVRGGTGSGVSNTPVVVYVDNFLVTS